VTLPAGLLAARLFVLALVYSAHTGGFDDDEAVG
jgi:hypothetical protein